MYCPNPRCPNILNVGVPAEFRDDIVYCAECEHALVPGVPPEARAPVPAEVGESGDWRVIAVYSSAEMAYVDKGLLAHEGILSLVANEHFAAISQLPAPVVGNVELSVHEADAARAYELIHRASEEGAELPLDDEYEPFEPSREPAEASAVKLPLQVLAVFLALAGLYLMLTPGGNVAEVPSRNDFYDHAAATAFARLHLSPRIDHVTTSEIERILHLDLAYIATLDISTRRELLELELNDAALFIIERKSGLSAEAKEIFGVLELRNLFLRQTDLPRNSA